MGDEPLNCGPTLPESKKITFTKFFEDACPYFMSIGMTYDQFWHGDAVSSRYYLKMRRIQKKQKNQEMWMQGNYEYVALETALSNAFRKKGSPVQEYLSEPFPIDKQESEERKEKARILKEEKIKAAFMSKAVMFNQQYASKQKENEGENVRTNN